MNKIVVLTSTLPRWKEDSTPSFVLDLIVNISSISDEYYFHIIAPHSSGAKIKESVSKRISIERIRYSIPYTTENIFYDGGASTKKKGIVFYIKSIIYLVSLTLKTFIEASKKDVKIINAHWLIPQSLVAVFVSRLIKKPVVVTVHGGDIFTINGPFGKRLKKYVLKKSTVVFVNSSITKEACNNIYQRDYKFGPMGVDENIFVGRASSHRWKKGKIIFVGRITKEKGVKYLVESMKFLDKHYELNIVGDGPEKENLIKLIKKLKMQKKVRLLGWLNHKQIVDELNKSSIFVGPSITLDNGWREGMGLVYLEALFSGLLVITTNATGAKDFIKDNTNGKIVYEKDPTKLASAIKELSQSKISKKDFNETLGFLREKYGWSRCSLRYIKVFEELM